MKTGHLPLRVFLGIALLCIVIFFIFNALGIQRLARLGMAPLEQRLQTLNMQNQLSCEENKQSLLVELSALKLVEEENASLREALEFKKKNKLAFVPLNVISRDPLNPSLLYLDGGSDDALVVGDPAIVANGIVLGKIIGVTKNTAVLELITSDSSRVAVRTLTADPASGIIRGHLGSSIHMEFILSDKTVTSGDTVITSGTETRIPQGLVVGTVTKTTRTADDLFITADINPAFDYRMLRVVSVIKNQ